MLYVPINFPFWETVFSIANVINLSHLKALSPYSMTPDLELYYFFFWLEYDGKNKVSQWLSVIVLRSSRKSTSNVPSDSGKIVVITFKADLSAIAFMGSTCSLE